MELDLRGHLALMVSEHGLSEEAPQSLRRAWLAVRLVDMLADRVFETWRTAGPEKLGHAEDLIAYRMALGTAEPALAILSELCSGRDGQPTLRRDMVPIAELDQRRLLFADWMITTYNNHEVPTVVLAMPGGERRQLHPILEQAVRFWQIEFETRDL